MYQEVRVSQLDGSSNNANGFFEASNQPRETSSYIRSGTMSQNQIQSQFAGSSSNSNGFFEANNQPRETSSYIRSGTMSQNQIQSQLDGSSSNSNVFYEANTQPRGTSSYVRSGTISQNQIQSQLDGSSSNTNVFYEISSQPRETSSYIRSGTMSQVINRRQSQIISDYDFKAVGKYTGQVLSSILLKNSKKGSILPNIELNFDKMDSNYCQEHGEIKDYILMSTPPQGFKIYDIICKNCLSQINYKNPNPVKAELFDSIIIDNKEKLLQIKQNKLDLHTGNSGELIELINETILHLADELIFLSEEFDNQITGKISSMSAKAEEIGKLKNFINSIEFTSSGDPNVSGIGKNEQLKNKYIKLALFLANFTEFSSDHSHVGIVESLKIHMGKMIQIRKVMVNKISTWLRYLSGEFYEFVHGLENLPVDRQFKQNLPVEYVSEEQLLQLKLFYEGELRKRDDRIRVLEDENIRYRKEIDTLKTSLGYMSEQETIISELRLKLQKFESENAYQKQNISSLTNENQRIIELNSQYLKQIEIFRTEITQLKVDYDKKIGEYILNINQWTVKYSELDSKYNIDVRKSTADIDTLQGQIRIINQRYDNDVKALNEKYDSLFKEYNNIKMTANNYFIQINQLTNDKQGLEKTIETHVLRIRSLEDDLNKSNNSIQILVKERDDGRSQIIILKSDIEKFRGEINILTNIKITYEGKINELQKKCDDLSALYVKLQNDFNVKLTIIANLNSDIEKLRGEINILTNIKITYEGRINELQKKNDDLSTLYVKLENEFNLKLTIIANYEKRLRELDDVVCSSEGAIDSYLEQIRKLEEKLDEFVKENNDLKVKLYQRETEISGLKLSLTTCRDEWNKLSEAYEGLLVDIKTQISFNDTLRLFIFELQSKIENHNQQVGGLDSIVRQQLEILTKHTLSKKSIEYNQIEAVRKSQIEVENLRSKLGRIESYKLTKSSVFSNVNISLSLNNNDDVDANRTKNVITNNPTRYFDNLVYQNKAINNPNSNVTNYYNSNNNLISSNNGNINAGGNASVGGYRNTTAISYDQNLISNNNAYSNAGGNISAGGHRNTTAITYNQNSLNNPTYTYKTTYDKSYGANVFNNAYATKNSALNASNISYKSVNDLDKNANNNSNYVAVGCTIYGEEKNQVAENNANNNSNYVAVGCTIYGEEKNQVAENNANNNSNYVAVGCTIYGEEKKQVAENNANNNSNYFAVGCTINGEEKNQVAENNEETSQSQ